MGRNKIDIKRLNEKVNNIRREIVDLRNMIFNWGKQDDERINELKAKISQLMRKEVKDEK